MKKIVIALSLVVAATGAVAQTSAADCENYGHMVGSMQSIRNSGGSINIVFKDLENLVNNTGALERDYGGTLTGVAQYIWSQPQGAMTREQAAVVGEMSCNKLYRKK
jgi:hypothetical protein